MRPVPMASSRIGPCRSGRTMALRDRSVRPSH
jgi:hypothetical protein